MRISSGDARCRYLAAPGTTTDSLSAFGHHLKSLGIALPNDCSLRHMVESGWISPVLRVQLPQAAFETWTDYPNLSMRGTEHCPESDRWALGLWANAMCPPPPALPTDPSWWVYFLDDATEPLTIEVRAHTIDAHLPTSMPPSFPHAGPQKIPTWLDFFSYWQAYHVAELLRAVSLTVRVTPGFDKRVAGGAETLLQLTDARAKRIARRWEARRSTFEWLSRFRTLLASWSHSEREWSDVVSASTQLARDSRLTGDRVVAKIRNTLLVLWQEWSHFDDPLLGNAELRGLLRQDIEYALSLAEILSGRSADFLAPCWKSRDRHTHEWAQLIDALPLEDELARHRFPRMAMDYLKDAVATLPAPLAPSTTGIEQLLAQHWHELRPLRRFCLAFSRVHEQLSGPDLREEKVIRCHERIDQLVAMVLNAERVLAAVHRQRSGSRRHSDLIPMVRGQISHLLPHLDLPDATAQRHVIERLNALLPRTKLHEIANLNANLFILPADVSSGSPAADCVTAGFVNFVIARNYAAHHDSLDEDLIYPNDRGPADHLGRIAVVSSLMVVVSCLQSWTSRSSASTPIRSGTPQAVR